MGQGFCRASLRLEHIRSYLDAIHSEKLFDPPKTFGCSVSGRFRTFSRKHKHSGEDNGITTTKRTPTIVCLCRHETQALPREMIGKSRGGEWPHVPFIISCLKLSETGSWSCFWSSSRESQFASERVVSSEKASHKNTYITLRPQFRACTQQCTIRVQTDKPAMSKIEADRKRPAQHSE